jgi:putative acetyltransferase
MPQEIHIRNYLPEDVEALASIYFNTIHRINIENYSQEQIDVWAPKSSLKIENWAQKFLKTQPIIAVVREQIVGFVEFESNGHIDCFYVHHDWIGKGVGKALMQEIFFRARSQNIQRIFAEVSITAKPFFEKQGFSLLSEQTVVIKGIGLTNYKMEKRV